MAYKPQDRPSRLRTLDGAAEARLIALACSATPAGSRTAGSACSSATPRRAAGPCSTGAVLPQEWAADPERRERAGVPPAVAFATKIVLARQLSERAVTADAVYGSDHHFWLALENEGLGYAVRVRGDFAVWFGLRQVRAKQLLAAVPADGWRRLSCGDGAKGPRLYDWTLLLTNAPAPERHARWLLPRRSVSDPSVGATSLAVARPRL
jgi:DDE superfamily endonuclease